MHFVKTDGVMTAAEKVAQMISGALMRKQAVVWLISGGSAVDVAVEARDLLTDTTGLTVMQVDERFGPVGHADSNWRKLLDAGFNTDEINCEPVLIGKSLDETLAAYSRALEQAITANTFTIALLGMGADGHVAGILPGSPAATSTAFIASYKGSDFTRLTITPTVIERLDKVVLYAMGDSKRAALETLENQNVSIEKQPAQVLKEMEGVWIFNDQIGDAA